MYYWTSNYSKVDPYSGLGIINMSTRLFICVLHNLITLS